MMLVIGVMDPFIAWLAADELPVIAVVPVMLLATLVTFVPPDRNHTLNWPLAARTTTNLLVASTTVPRSNANVLRPWRMSVSRQVLARWENMLNARACDHV